MLTYTLLALAVVFVLFRWTQFHKSKRNELSLGRIDADFKSQLNHGDAHEK
ncbi:hypothetical protein [Paenibacillus periandrae]|uniref:hypothetical protein n=1 Tax=Paenibacillus periandrae TaxID=1761741 RepID=UPI001F09BA05|nr:hypothetical protein [Paenibacillus periandrae]